MIFCLLNRSDDGTNEFLTLLNICLPPWTIESLKPLVFSHTSSLIPFGNIKNNFLPLKSEDLSKLLQSYWLFLNHHVQLEIVLNIRYVLTGQHFLKEFYFRFGIWNFWNNNFLLFHFDFCFYHNLLEF